MAWLGTRWSCRSGELSGDSPGSDVRDVFARSGTLWYVGDGMISGRPQAAESAVPRAGSSSTKLFVFNPGMDDASVRLRFYDLDGPPRTIEMSVGARRILTAELEALDAVPRDRPFWIALESSTPVVPQLRHDNYAGGDGVPEAIVAVAPYPGPLDETTWLYPDGFQGGTERWYENETITLLNPGEQAVRARLHYVLRESGVEAEEEIEVPAERVAVLNTWERRPTRVGPWGGEVEISGDYATRIEASGPIITQQTRRARWRGRDEVTGARAVMGVPLRGGGHRLWYLPGGEFVPRGVHAGEPSWNLLFTHNLDRSWRARVSVGFHTAIGNVGDALRVHVGAQRSELQWLNRVPSLAVPSAGGGAFALTLTSDRPIVAELTAAEFEPDGSACPGAMSAVNLYPGPLRNERTWWLGIAETGEREASATSWLQSYFLFNPAREAARVRLTIFDDAGRTMNPGPIVIAPGAVARLTSSQIAGLPAHRPLAVRADGDAPFAVLVNVRAFRRGAPYTRAMYAMLGLPMSLTASGVTPRPGSASHAAR
jgi:hypothetical protein